MKKIGRKDGKSFKVIEENRTTYGTAPRRKMMDELCSILTEDELDVLPGFIVYDFYSYIDNKAQATCDDKDEFNEKIGMDVVAAKLDMKDHLRMAKNYDRALRIMNAAMRKLEDMCNKHWKKAMAIRKDLEEYYGGDIR